MAHCTFRICGKRSDVDGPRIWFFRWGFGVWLRNVIFSCGHDTRSGIYVHKEGE